MLARQVLERQLTKLGLLGSGEDLARLGKDGQDFIASFKDIWAEHADMLSKQYAGTGALKTDFTRTGKRTVRGAAMDGVNSLHRYVLNNFRDGFRQDSFDLFLGNYVVDESEGVSRPSPLRVERDWKYRYLPIVFLFAFAMCVLCFLFPTVEWTEQAMYILFWSTACVVTLFIIFTYGTDFVDKPKLKPE